MTLLEMIVAMVLLAIVVGATLFFAFPIQQATDVTVRAQLTDVADNALQRIGRDVRLALPNTVRVMTSGGVSYLEFMPLRTGGRYRVESSGACTGGSGTNELAFDDADACFTALGPILNNADVATGDFLVLNNYGTNFTNQDAYAASSNKQAVQSASATTVVLSANANFVRQLHDSPGRRFFIAGPPVTYRCDPGTGHLTRHTGYGVNASQSAAVGAGVDIATSVSECSFDYSPGVAAHIGLLTLRLALSRPVSTGTETVSLYHAVHVNNMP